IPNRTVKRLYADDSADSRVKVGNRQAPLKPETPARKAGVFALVRQKSVRRNGAKATSTASRPPKPATSTQSSIRSSKNAVK
ncbi:hypothetical protein, partial [Burkholderia cenocepacia]|uniref:hypothetical protein n=1 Tax=Burkholderia cenocepacia TaxID=95486 RepID=UPI002861A19A